MSHARHGLVRTRLIDGLAVGSSSVLLYALLCASPDDLAGQACCEGHGRADMAANQLNHLGHHQPGHYCTRRVGEARGSQMARQGGDAGDAGDAVQVPEQDGSMACYVGVVGSM